MKPTKPVINIPLSAKGRLNLFKYISTHKFVYFNESEFRPNQNDIKIIITPVTNAMAKAAENSMDSFKKLVTYSNFVLLVQYDEKLVHSDYQLEKRAFKYIKSITLNIRDKSSIVRYTKHDDTINNELKNQLLRIYNSTRKKAEDAEHFCKRVMTHAAIKNRDAAIAQLGNKKLQR